MARGLVSTFSGVVAGVVTSVALTAAGVPSQAVAAVEAIDAAKTARSVVAYDSPYKLGDYKGSLSPTSMARLVSTRGEGSGSRSFAIDDGYLAKYTGAAAQETRDPSTARGSMALGQLQGQSKVGRFITPGQETRDWSQYDAGRIRAEIDTLADRHRDYGGYENKPQDPNANLPMQVVRDLEGKVIMQGRAESVEHLIAQKLMEAERATDPAKKVVNLAGADLGDQKLDFRGFNFKNVDLRGANMAGCAFTDCKFENVDMHGANLKGARFDKCHLENVNMNEFVGDHKTAFKNCTLQNVHMEDAVAPQIKFEGIRAENLNMARANFDGSSWSDVQISNLWAPGVKLNGAKLGDFHVIGRDSNMDGAELNNATIHNASFGTSEHGIRMRGISAQNSHWSDVQFNKSDLSGADFTRAVFQRVDMRNVVTPEGPMQMREANITGLEAGPDAKFRAFKAQYDGVTMFPAEDFVFKGTDPIRRAAKAAIDAGVNVANITTADGLTEQELAARQAHNGPQVVQRRPQMMPGMAPIMPGMKRRDTPWS
jgi:uncharacterized protein YjbI with pentapeptide repeats